MDEELSTLQQSKTRIHALIKEEHDQIKVLRDTWDMFHKKRLSITLDLEQKSFRKQSLIWWLLVVFLLAVGYTAATRGKIILYVCDLFALLVNLRSLYFTHNPAAFGFGLIMCALSVYFV